MSLFIRHYFVTIVTKMLQFPAGMMKNICHSNEIPLLAVRKLLKYCIQLINLKRMTNTASIKKDLIKFPSQSGKILY
jgi:predicted transcriptional regulator